MAGLGEVGCTNATYLISILPTPSKLPSILYGLSSGALALPAQKRSMAALRKKMWTTMNCQASRQ